MLHNTRECSEAMVNAFIAVGSNIEPRRHIPDALDKLQGQARVTGVSTFYRTEPLGGRAQPAFLNGVWRLETAISPRALKFDVLRTIESELGRVRTTDKYAARTIDLDLILYGERIVDEPDLILPDPDMRVRSFIAVPLLEIAPDLVIPGTGERLAFIVASLSTRRLEPDRNFTRGLQSRVSS